MPDPHPFSPDVDKRVERSRASVLKEAYALLIQAGIGGVSVDEISRRSGVSKTTIYRHWRSRSALLLDACSKLGGAVDAPETGTVEGDLDLLARCLTQELRVAGWATILPSIVEQPSATLMWRRCRPR